MSQHLPTTKRDKIIYLLNHWDEIHDPDASSPQGSPGNGTNTPHLGSLAHHHSVLELVRCLDLLGIEAPTQRSHLMAYYRAEWRIENVVKRAKGGKVVMKKHPAIPTIRIPDTTPRRQRLVPRWVRAEKVKRAESRLVELFRGECKLPEDFEWALTLSSSEVEAKLAERRRRVVARSAA